MATAARSGGTTGRRLLVEWANDQDHWVRGLVAEVLSSRRPLTEDAVEHFYELLLREKELAPGEAPSVEKLEDADGGVPTEEPLALMRISDVENVNALAPKQEIVHDRCCRFIGSHKQPLETLNVRPTLEKLQEDWSTIQEVHRVAGGHA